MKKLKLMLDELAVETFETVESTDRRGTVVGQSGTTGGIRQCQFQCPSPTDDCYSAMCIPTDDPCTSLPGATVEYSCDCLSNEWACPDTQECLDVTSFGEATTC